MHLLKHIFSIFMLAVPLATTAPGPVGGGDSSGSPSPSPDGGGASPSATPPSSPAPGGESVGIQQLRTQYETLKGQYEPWSKLGVMPDQVGQFQQVYQRTFEQVASIGRDLGYPDDEIIEAMQENPVATLDYLRREYAEMQQSQQQPQHQQDLSQLIEERLNEALSPMQERENQRMTMEANSLFERTAYQMAAETFRKEGLDIANVPQDEVSLLLSATSEILKYDEDALRALKYNGQTAAIQKAFTEAKTMLDKYYIARSGRDRGRPVVPGRSATAPQTAAPGGRKPSLDDLIGDPSLINSKYAEKT